MRKLPAAKEARMRVPTAALQIAGARQSRQEKCHGPNTRSYPGGDSAAAARHAHALKDALHEPLAHNTLALGALVRIHV